MKNRRFMRLALVTATCLYALLGGSISAEALDASAATPAVAPPGTADSSLTDHLLAALQYLDVPVGGDSKAIERKSPSVPLRVPRGHRLAIDLKLQERDTQFFLAHQPPPSSPGASTSADQLPACVVISITEGVGAESKPLAPIARDVDLNTTNAQPLVEATSLTAAEYRLAVRAAFGACAGSPIVAQPVCPAPKLSGAQLTVVTSEPGNRLVLSDAYFLVGRTWLPPLADGTNREWQTLRIGANVFVGSGGGTGFWAGVFRYVGLNVSLLDFNHDAKLRPGFGLIVAPMDRVLFAGVGYNPTMDQGYYAFFGLSGIELKSWIDKNLK